MSSFLLTVYNTGMSMSNNDDLTMYEWQLEDPRLVRRLVESEVETKPLPGTHTEVVSWHLTDTYMALDANYRPHTENDVSSPTCSLFSWLFEGRKLRGTYLR